MCRKKRKGVEEKYDGVNFCTRVQMFCYLGIQSALSCQSTPCSSMRWEASPWVQSCCPQSGIIWKEGQNLIQCHQLRKDEQSSASLQYQRIKLEGTPIICRGSVCAMASYNKSKMKKHRKKYSEGTKAFTRFKKKKEKVLAFITF